MDYYYLINKDDWTTTAFGENMTPDEAQKRNENLSSNREYMTQDQVSKVINPQNKNCSGVNHHLYTVCLNCGMIG